MACPPPYFLLLSALPPPFYPTTLALCGLVLLTAAQAGRRLGEADGSPPRGTLLMLGLFSGLALWTHLMSASAVAAAALWVLLCSRGKRRLLIWAVVPLLAASAPLWSRALQDAEAMRIVQVADRNETTLQHLAATLPHLHEPLGGVLGTHVPVVADAEDFMLYHRGWAAALTVLLYGLMLVLAGRAVTSRSPALLLFAAAALALVAFPFPVRSAPHTIRLLTPLYLPVAALVAWAASPRGTTRRAWVLVLALASLHLALATRLLDTWRRTDRAEAPFALVDLQPVRNLLDAHGVRHAYASYGPAFRLTWESGERIVASPPWNDRFRHWPLPLLDEVRFAKNVAWVLTPSVASGLPTPEEFDQTLARLGGRWRRDAAGAAVVFQAFVPPFAPQSEPWPGAGAVGDRDLRSFAAPAPGETFELRLDSPRPLVAITLLAALDGPRLPRSADVHGERRRRDVRDGGHAPPPRRAPGPALARRPPAGGHRPRRRRGAARRPARGRAARRGARARALARGRGADPHRGRPPGVGRMAPAGRRPGTSAAARSSSARCRTARTGTRACCWPRATARRRSARLWYILI